MPAKKGANLSAKNPYNFKNIDREQVKAMGSVGGREAGKKRKERRKLSESMSLLLSLNIGQGKEFDIESAECYEELRKKNLTMLDLANMALLQKALNGDVNAYNAIRDLIGEKPVDKVDVNGDVPVVIKGEDELIE